LLARETSRRAGLANELGERPDRPSRPGSAARQRPTGRQRPRQGRRAQPVARMVRRPRPPQRSRGHRRAPQPDHCRADRIATATGRPAIHPTKGRDLVRAHPRPADPGRPTPNPGRQRRVQPRNVRAHQTKPVRRSGTAAGLHSAAARGHQVPGRPGHTLAPHDRGTVLLLATSLVRVAWDCLRDDIRTFGSTASPAPPPRR
jgi:hypothetical protein